MINFRKEFDELFGPIFGLNKLPSEKANEIRGRLAGLIGQAVLMRVLPQLTEKELEQYEKITESDQDINAMNEFLSLKVPDYWKIVGEEMINLYNEIDAKSKK